MSLYLVPYLQLLCWALLPLAAGVLARRLGAPREASRHLFLFALFACQMPIVLLAVWVAEISRGAEYMPLFTLVAWLISVGIAWLGSVWMKHRPPQRGAFIVSICLSNHGYTLLGLVAMILFGDEGIAQATYAWLFIVPFMVFVCFPLGRYYGEGGGRMPARQLLVKTITDPKSVLVVAMAAGILLNLTGVARPECCAHIVRAMVYVGTITTGLAVGLLLRGSALRRFVRENAFSFAYRSTLYPGMFLVMAMWAGLDRLNTNVLVLFGIVPSALFASMIADLFDLDTDLTSSLFIVSTLLFVFIVLPLYVLAVT
jgi:hypothetical protein